MDRIIRWAPAEGVVAESVVVGARHGTLYGLRGYA